MTDVAQGKVATLHIAIYSDSNVHSLLFVRPAGSHSMTEVLEDAKVRVAHIIDPTAWGKATTILTNSERYIFAEVLFDEDDGERLLLSVHTVAILTCTKHYREKCDGEGWLWLPIKI